VKRSIEIGKPVVAVAIKYFHLFPIFFLQSNRLMNSYENSYRLSVLGYIGSEELAAEFGKQNNGNQGPRDAVPIPGP
jgi:hypothetical protein